MPEVRRRPKNRKAQISAVAAQAFSEMGYHAVGMEDIAQRVGVSAPALYRHAHGKYDLFRDAVLGLSGQLVEATGYADQMTVSADAAPDMFDGLVATLVDVALANRTTGGVYRWGGRFLEKPDLATLMSQVRLVNERLQRPLSLMRPDLDARQRWTVSVSVLGIVGSIVDHRTVLAATRVHEMFAWMTRAVAATELPEVAVVAPGRPAEGLPAGRFEAILHEAARLFRRRGYRQTTVDELAAAVGMPTTGIYRYFDGKANILTALFRRTADRLSADTADILAAESDPMAAVDRLVECYVARTFESPEVDALYFTERINLPPADAALLRAMQRETVDTWVQLLIRIHHGLTEREAWFAVQAAFALAVDLARLAGYQDSAAVRATVCALMRGTVHAPAVALSL